MREENQLEPRRDVLEAFLKGYVELMRAEFPWQLVAPCIPKADMPSGVARVLDRNGNAIAYFHTKRAQDEYDPSMPVTPRDFACAKLLSSAINFLAFCQEKEEEKVDAK